MKRLKNVFRMFAAGCLAMTLLASPALAADGGVRVGSCKGSTLEVGERSALIIGPSGPAYDAASSNPEVVAVEQVLTFWVAVAKTEGTAEIVVSDGSNTGNLTLTVGQAQAPAAIDLNANLDIRLKMVQYINEIRRANGKTELAVSEALMNAAQDVSSQCVTEHRPYDHEALARYGWPYGGLYNLTVFSGCPDAAGQAAAYWMESPGHRETMLSEGSHAGTGVTFKNGRAYCYMVVGDPDSCNPYA